MNNQYRKDESTGTLICKVCGLEKDDYASMIRHKHYTVKEWKRFDRWAERENGVDYTFQEIVLRDHEIILLNHKTKREKLNGIMDKFTIQNLDKSLTILSNGIDKFAKSMGPAKQNRKHTKEPDYSALFFGKAETKRRPKRNAKRTKRANPLYSEKPDYSALIGKRKTRIL